MAGLYVHATHSLFYDADIFLYSNELGNGEDVEIAPKIRKYREKDILFGRK